MFKKNEEKKGLRFKGKIFYAVGNTWGGVFVPSSCQKPNDVAGFIDAFHPVLVELTVTRVFKRANPDLIEIENEILETPR